MPYLPWINDKSLKLAVTHILETARTAKLKAKDQLGRNVIDPFSAVFEMAGFEVDHDDWITSETTRQAQKTLQNHIGEFHQIILGSVSGWENMNVGNEIDLVNKKSRIIAEIKNKYNTLSGGQLSNMYYSLSNLVMAKASRYKGYTAYYVMVIPKTPHRFNDEFRPSDRSKGAPCPSNPKVRVTDGASFYELVTGDHNALEELYSVLPDVISKCSGVQLSAASKKRLTAFFDAAFIG